MPKVNYDEHLLMRRHCVRCKDFRNSVPVWLATPRAVLDLNGGNVLYTPIYSFRLACGTEAQFTRLTGMTRYHLEKIRLGELKPDCLDLGQLVMAAYRLGAQDHARVFRQYLGALLVMGEVSAGGISKLVWDLVVDGVTRGVPTGEIWRHVGEEKGQHKTTGELRQLVVDTLMDVMGQLSGALRWVNEGTLQRAGVMGVDAKRKMSVRNQHTSAVENYDTYVGLWRAGVEMECAARFVERVGRVKGETDDWGGVAMTQQVYRVEVEAVLDSAMRYAAAAGMELEGVGVGEGTPGPETPRRRRGRPPGAKNKAKGDMEEMGKEMGKGMGMGKGVDNAK